MVNVNELIPSLVENGVFGEFKFVDFKENNQTEKGVQFASSLSFYNLIVRGSSGEKLLPLVVKTPTKDFEDFRDTQAMFYNEVNMYKHILPALGYRMDLVPKMYYGNVTDDCNSNNDIIILENLTFKGFVPSKPKIFLDFDHLSLAIKKIAEFHSHSYKLKNEKKENLVQLVKMLKKVEEKESAKQEMEIVGAGALKRGVEAALKKTVANDVLTKFLKLFEKSNKLLTSLLDPEEPFSVICHGDFCNNNLLFKYSESDDPVDCVFFDFQLSVYSSPAVDLMFFLYMHTTSETREKHWDEILKLYWDTVRENVPSGLPSFKEFIEHIGKRAIYGYLISAWFLPVMLSKDEMMQPADYNKLDIEEKKEIFRNLAGEKGEEIVCSIILHLFKKNYLHKFLNFCDEKEIQY